MRHAPKILGIQAIMAVTACAPGAGMEEGVEAVTPWSNVIGAETQEESAWDVAVDPAGTILVAGSSRPPESGTTAMIWVASFAANGDLNWKREVFEAAWDTAASARVAVDDARVYVAGAAVSDDPDQGTDIRVTALTNDGEPLWSVGHDGTADVSAEQDRDTPFDLLALPGGGVFVAGQTLDVGQPLNPEDTVRARSWVAEYSAAGDVRWEWTSADVVGGAAAFGLASGGSHVLIVGAEAETPSDAPEVDGSVRALDGAGGVDWAVFDDGIDDPADGVLDYLGDAYTSVDRAPTGFFAL